MIICVVLPVITVISLYIVGSCWCHIWAIGKNWREAWSLVVLQVAVLFVGRLLHSTTLGLCWLLFLLGLLCQQLLHHSTLQHELVLQLSLLSLSELRELLYDVLTVFKTKSTDYLPSFAVPLSLRYIIVLLTHVHVSSCISGVFFPAVVKARVLFLQLLCTTSYMFLPLRLPFANLLSHLVLHLQILYQSIHKFVLRVHEEVLSQTSLGHRSLQLTFLKCLILKSTLLLASHLLRRLDLIHHILIIKVRLLVLTSFPVITGGHVLLLTLALHILAELVSNLIN